MGRYKTPKSEGWIQRRIDEGRGQGEGSTYKPWILKHEFPSRGLAREVPGVKAGRNHQVFSKIEYHVFLICEQNPLVVDIREQFPLSNRQVVADICSSYSITIPRYSGSKVPRVLSTDFMLTLMMNKQKSYMAVSVKSSSSVSKKRTAELQHVEKVYWEKQQIPWVQVTEKDFPMAFPMNVRWMRQAAIFPLGVEHFGCPNAFKEVFDDVYDEHTELKELLTSVSDLMSIPYENAVALFQHNGWWGNIPVDIFEKIHLRRPLKLVRHAESSTKPPFWEKYYHAARN